MEGHRACMRTAVGLSSVPLRLYRELLQYSLHLHWCRLVLRFWNKLVGCTRSLAHHAIVADVGMALAGCISCWAHQYLHSAGLGAAEHLNITDRIDYYIRLVVPAEELCQQMADRFDGRWAEVLGGCGVKVHRYARWMGLLFTHKAKNHVG